MAELNVDPQKRLRCVMTRLSSRKTAVERTLGEKRH